MTEFTTAPQRKRIPMGWALAAVLLIAGSAAGVYANEIRDWFYGTIYIGTSGQITNEDGNVVGEVLDSSDKHVDMQIDGQSFRMEVDGDGQLPDGPFSISFDGAPATPPAPSNAAAAEKNTPASPAPKK